MFKLLELEPGVFINPRHVTKVWQDPNHPVVVGTYIDLLNGKQAYVNAVAWEVVELIEKEANKSFQREVEDG